MIWENVHAWQFAHDASMLQGLYPKGRNRTDVILYADQCLTKNGELEAELE